MQLAPKGIRVNAICPGPVHTPLQPASRPAEQMEDFNVGELPLWGRANMPAEMGPAYGEWPVYCCRWCGDDDPSEAKGTAGSTGGSESEGCLIADLGSLLGVCRLERHDRPVHAPGMWTVHACKQARSKRANIYRITPSGSVDRFACILQPFPTITTKMYR
jgi:hypothetical protein